MSRVDKCPAQPGVGVRPRVCSPVSATVLVPPVIGAVSVKFHPRPMPVQLQPETSTISTTTTITLMVVQRYNTCQLHRPPTTFAKKEATRTRLCIRGIIRCPRMDRQTLVHMNFDAVPDIGV